MFYVNYYWNLYYVNYTNKEYKIVFSYHKKFLKFTKNTREPSFIHDSYIDISLEPPKICLFAERGARLRDKNSRTVTELKNKAPWVGRNIWKIIIQPCVEAFVWINFKRGNHFINIEALIKTVSNSESNIWSYWIIQVTSKFAGSQIKIEELHLFESHLNGNASGKTSTVKCRGRQFTRPFQLNLNVQSVSGNKARSEIKLSTFC